jgi:cell division protein FtsL
MATLANFYNRVLDRSVDGRAEPPKPRTRDASTRVRAFANEDIYFYIKRIDNSDVVREADPQARGACWKLIGSVVAAAVLLIGVLLPSAYSLLAGYKIQALQQEQQRLATEQASLELQEATLVSPARMEELAREQQFIDPPSQKVVYLDTKGGSLALNAK